MRGVENDARARAGKFDDNIFHGEIAEGRRAVEVVLFDRTAVAFQLANDIRLRAMNPVRCRRPRANFHEVTDVLVRARTIELCGVGGRIEGATSGERGL